jgi:integrase
MCAACRRHELTNMKVEDVQDRGDVIIIKIPDTKTKKPRTSCITEPLWINILKKYKSLRPPGIQHTRFFFKFYSKNKCTVQSVGIHTFAAMPCQIVTFLKLQNPSQYTGHCFRRSSATVLAGHGADITTLKRHDGWKSTTAKSKQFQFT